MSPISLVQLTATVRKSTLDRSFILPILQYVMSGHNFKIIRNQSELPISLGELKVSEYDFKQELFKNHFVTPSVMIRRDSKIKFQAGRSDMDDHLLWLELVSEYEKNAKINLPLAFIFKGQWGEGGLSSRLWIMEKGNLKTFIYLFNQNKIGLPLCLLMIAQSTIRFVRRLLIQYVGKRLKRA